MSAPLTVDRFRRLARSSPWLWRTLEFRWTLEHEQPRHAWIRRPGSMRVEDENGQLIEVALGTKPFPGTLVGTAAGLVPMSGRWPSEIEPVYADDGLVAALPDEIGIDWDSPFFDNYHWVAMLNPIEFADRVHDIDSAPGTVSVELRDLTIVDHHGRPAWQATAHPTALYDPRCDCCPLLSGQFDDELKAWAPGPPSLVRIDAATGVCVRIEGSGSLELDVEIVAVDQPLDDALFTQSRRP